MESKEIVEIEEIRSEIEKIDIKLLELFRDRFKKAESIAIYKKINNLPIYDQNREKLLLKKLQNKNIIDPLHVYQLWNEIFFISRSIQKDVLKNQ